MHLDMYMVNISIWHVYGKYIHLHRCLEIHIRQLPLKTPRSQNPQSWETQNSRYLAVQFKMMFWFNLNVYWGLWVSRYGGFRGRCIFSGNCHKEPTLRRTRWRECVYTRIRLNVYIHTHAHTYSAASFPSRNTHTQKFTSSGRDEVSAGTHTSVYKCASGYTHFCIHAHIPPSLPPLSIHTHPEIHLL